MKVYEVVSGRRYWVVRAESGNYFSHFTTHGFVAMGHLKDLGFSYPNMDSISFAEADFLSLFKSKFNKTTGLLTRRLSTFYNQARAFIYEVKDGDWVITIGDGGLRVGLVDGPAYIDNSPSVIYRNESPFEMDYALRRSVKWGPFVRRADIPYGLAVSLRANQTLFNLDKHSEAIYHTLYPFFLMEDCLHLSLNIKAEHDLSNYSVTKLFSILNEAEVLSLDSYTDLAFHNFHNNDFDITDLDAAVKHFAQLGLLTLTTKAQFHSPGDVWAKVKNTLYGGKYLYYIIAFHGLLFGNSHMGVDGIIDLESRQLFWKIIAEKYQSNSTIVKDLNLKLPSYDTNALESMDGKFKLSHASKDLD